MPVSVETLSLLVKAGVSGEDLVAVVRSIENDCAPRQEKPNGLKTYEINTTHDMWKEIEADICARHGLTPTLLWNHRRPHSYVVARHDVTPVNAAIQNGADE